jgi:hypothetical protein
MPSSTDFPARGRVIAVDDNAVIFAPSNTTYELKLLTSGRYDGPVNTLIDGYVRGTARKLWTVASGGNFLTPIKGPTRIVQGRIKYLDNQVMVVQAGAPVIVDLPRADTSYDLNNGPLAVGALVNCTILPGASFSIANAAPAAGAAAAAAAVV